MAGVLLPGLARAQVEVGAGVPFSADELAGALATRGVAMDLTVLAVAGSTIELVTPTSAERIDLGAAHGVAAARLVALYLIDAPAPADAIAVTAPARHAPRPVWLAIGPIAGRGVASVDLVLVGASIGAVLEAPRWRFGATVAWLHGGAAADPAQPIGADELLARLDLGARLGPVEVTLGPTVGRYRTAGTRGWLRGGHAGAAVQLAGGPTWRVRAALAAELDDPRVIVRLDGRAFAATPRVALTAGLELAWAVAR
jgi:hypothetical protein